MKRLFLIFLVLGLMLTLCACGAAGGESDGASAPDAEEALEATEAPPPDSVGFYLGTGGGIARYRPLTDSELTGDISPAGLLFPEDRDVALPVYGNPYPVGQGAAKYDVTEEMQEAMEQRLFSFLELLLGDYDPQKYPISYEEAQDYATHSAMIPHISISEDVFISSNPRNMYVHMESGGEETARLLPDGDLRQSPMLAAVLDYMGIDEPETEYSVQYQEDGEVRYEEYTIYQKTDGSGQTITERAFNSVHVYHSPGSPDNLAIYFDKQYYQPISGEFTAVTLGQALGAVERTIPGLAREEVQARLSYSREIREEYFIPCWELYLPTEDRAADGTPLYAFLLVPAVDPAELE